MSAPYCVRCGAELTFLDEDLGHTECEDCLHADNLDAAIRAVTDLQAKLDMSEDKHLEQAKLAEEER